MPKISPGARQLPMRHVSIRVPWHDTDWTGKICQNPANNISCLVLPRIRESRQDNDEAAIAGQSWEDLDEQQLPPCVSERHRFVCRYS